MSRSLYYLMVILFVSSGNMVAQYPCINDTVSYNGVDYPCQNVDLLANMSLSTVGGSGTEANDIWGWTYEGREFVILGLKSGTSFIEITDPIHPNYLGFLPSGTANNSWRDIRTYENYAFIVSENSNQGIQVFDLRKLLNVTSPPETFSHEVRYKFTPLGGKAHNISDLKEKGYMIVVGGNENPGTNGGLEFINVQDPLNPVYEGFFGQDEYTHDAVCFVYRGPDLDYQNKEICIASNEDSQTIVEITDKENSFEIQKVSYTNSRYTHQGWVSDDHRFAFFNDELDEYRLGFKTRTHVMNIEDLDNPYYIGYYEHDVLSIDHNCFVRGQYVFQANYNSGLRILNINGLNNDPQNEITLEGYFDTYPQLNSPTSFFGSWGVYPFFPSGVIAVSNRQEGLFILQLTSPGFVMNYSQETKDLCSGDNTMTFKIGVQSYGGYSDPVTLSATNLPLGTTASFDSNPAIPGDTVMLTLTGTSSLNGTFNINVSGEGPGNNAAHQFVLSFNTIPSIPSTLAFSNQSFAADETYAARDMIQLDNISIDNNAQLTFYAPILEVKNDLTIAGGGKIRWIKENQCDQE